MIQWALTIISGYDRINPIHKPLKWKTKAELSKGPVRWAAWARSIIDRRTHIVQGRAMAFILMVQPKTRSIHFYPRLIRYLWTFSPKINVVIWPILQGRIEQIMLTENREGKPKLNILPKTLYHYLETPGVRLQKGQQIQMSMEESGNGLNMITLHRPSSITVVSLPRTLIRQEHRDILQRIVNEHLRIEEVTHRHMMILKQRALNITETEADHPYRKSRYNSSSDNDSGMVEPKVSSTFNVEHLTEQVIRRLDDRIRAYKERMGKSFS